MSSIAARVQERLDAELSETDAEGRPAMAEKVAETLQLVAATPRTWRS